MVNGISILVKETGEASWPTAAARRHYELRNRPLPETDTTDDLILTFSPLEVRERRFFWL